MEDEDQVMDEGTLQNPDQLSPQERTDELVKSVEEDDLLAVLLMVDAMAESEINAASSEGSLRPLEAAIVVPSGRADARKLIVEVLLLSGAEPSSAVPFAQQSGNEAMQELLRGWNDGGREQATTAAQLLDMDFEDVEEWIGANLAEQVKVYQAAIPSPSPLPIKAEPLNELVQPELVDELPSTPCLPPPPPVTQPQLPSAPPLPPHSFDPAPIPEPDAVLDGSSEQTRRRELPLQRRRSTSPLSASPLRDRSRTRSPRARTPQPPPEPSSWVTITNLPADRSERFLYEYLQREGIDVDNIHLEPNLRKPVRLAFVGLRAEQSVDRAIHVLRRCIVDRHQLQADFFRSRSGGSKPGFVDSWRRPYLGTTRNIRFRPPGSSVEVVFKHLKRGVGVDQLEAFVERRLGLGLVRRSQVVMSGKKAETTAIIRLADEDACRRAIEELDGAVWNGTAMCVDWAVNASSGQQDDSIAPLPESRYTSPHRRGISPSPSPDNRSPYRSPRYTPSRSDYDSRRPSNEFSPERRSASVLDEVNANASSPLDSRLPPSYNAPPDCDVDRLRAVELPSPTINAVRSVWSPVLSTAPDQAVSTSTFNRSVQFEVDFGFVITSEAKAAQESHAAKPAYADDPAKQQRYEAFLKAQAGESKAWYLTFLARLSDFSRTAAAFVEKGRSGVSSNKQ